MPNRNISTVQVLGTYTSFGSPSQLSGQTYAVNETMTSSGHYGYPNFPENSNVGGAWNLSKTEFRTGSQAVHVMGGSTAYVNHNYKGLIVGPNDWPGFLPQFLDGTDYGAQAYARMKPTKPVFSGLNAIYELREVPEMLRQRFLKSGLHAIPDYWIALQFGWQPLLSDIVQTVTFQRQAQKRLAWLLQHNGKPVRRRVDLASSTTQVDEGTWGPFNGPNPGFVDYFYNGPRNIHHTRTLTDTVWAAARFRYWLPPGPQDINWERAMLARLYGLYPSPAALWNALPWTWMIDWFHSAGDVLKNMDIGVANRLAADYFYVMRENKYLQSADASCTMFAYPDKSPVSVNVQATREISYKSRLPGDPFGFNTSPNTLTGMQLSILGALGLSRLR